MKGLVVLIWVIFSSSANAFNSDEFFSYTIEASIQHDNYSQELANYRRSKHAFDGSENSSFIKNNYIGVNEVGTFLVAQIGAGALSALAAGSPEVAGWTYGVAAMMVGGSDQKKSVGMTAAIGLGALGAYNLSIDEEETSKEDIFIHNMLGLNLLFVSMFVSEQMFYDTDAELSLYPDAKGGWHFNFRYEF